MSDHVLRPEEMAAKAFEVAAAAVSRLSAELPAGPIEPDAMVKASHEAAVPSDGDTTVEVAGVGAVSRRALGHVAGPLIALVDRIRFLGRRDGSLPRDERRAAWDALAEGRLEDAAEIAATILAGLPDDAEEREINGGDSIHHANLVLGHLALLDGDVAKAEAHLLSAADTAGSPVLSSFGPNMSLALALLRRGRIDTVRTYFQSCGRFWPEPDRLSEWEADLDRGVTPRFGANLVYGRGDARVPRCALCRETEVQAGPMTSGASGARICRTCALTAHQAYQAS